MLGFVLVFPILSEILSKITGVSSVAMLLKVLVISIFIYKWSDFRKNTSLIFLVIVFVFIFSVALIYPPRYLITAVSDVFVLTFFCLCLLGVKKPKQFDVSQDSLYKSVLISIIFVSIGVFFNFVNLLLFPILEVISMPTEHSIRYLESSELNLISGFFASSKKLGKYCLVLSILSCFIKMKRRKLVLQSILLLLILLSGSREALYSLLIILVFSNVRFTINNLIYVSISIPLSVLILSYFNFGFYFAQSQDVSNRVDGYIYMLSNFDDIKHHGLGLLGRSVSLLGIDNIPGIVPYSFKGAAHDSTILWLYVCFSWFFIFPIIMYLIYFMKLIYKSSDRMVVCAFIVLTFNLIKAQSTIYDFYFIFFFTMGVTYISFYQEVGSSDIEENVYSNKGNV
ncbi:membrane hypothetical protein [Vibrio crassostreae]|uniref:hypothetical protein n=1 Tax=Vibrio crassostreae TaxID=246167 RepID=UPI001BD3A128|nr:hypothetical protein [Vibrio crassostreae]CAK2194390.1 membrane hypothetical protein [Vibrio crassostreae]CAK2230844.1 membrane hypothetical protein [Vibrio crassostreae]CAK2231549.1 membrane hypothetical protein [Vibrio crassostreae]CAK2276800.1 membrane hypothetical protein [Vibrio crassostreae]CAK2277816.1 membrane hypothetical protein [Vibrio crassostreae]